MYSSFVHTLVARCGTLWCNSTTKQKQTNEEETLTYFTSLFELLHKIRQALKDLFEELFLALLITEVLLSPQCCFINLAN